MTDHFTFHCQVDLPYVDQHNPTQRVLELSLQAPVPKERRARPPLNLALVIDRSGSMSGDKLGYAVLAAEYVLDLLREGDHIALVAYDDEVNLLQPSTAVTPSRIQELKTKLQSLRPGGMTNLGEGWLVGCQQVASTAQENEIHRVLLLTDGLANQGITDLEELSHHAGELHARGVSTSTFGLGLDFNEHLLEAMANQGGGRYYYIESPQQIPSIFLAELDELLQVTLRDVEITLTLPPFIEKEVLGGWKQSADNLHLRLSLGDLAAGQQRVIYIHLFIPSQTAAQEVLTSAVVMAKNEEGILLEDKADLRLQYLPEAELAKHQPDADLMRRYAVVYLAETLTTALKLDRHGEKNRAIDMLERAFERVVRYLEEDIRQEYRQKIDRFRFQMEEMEYKLYHSRAYFQKQRRDRDDY